MHPVPNPQNIALTRGVFHWAQTTSMTEYVFSVIRDEFDKQPDVATDGGNDKFFFSFTVGDKRLFAAANELNGLTVMFPEEY